MNISDCIQKDPHLRELVELFYDHQSEQEIYERTEEIRACLPSPLQQQFATSGRTLIESGSLRSLLETSLRVSRVAIVAALQGLKTPEDMFSYEQTSFTYFQSPQAHQTIKLSLPIQKSFRITALPREIAQLKKLKTLNLYDSRIAVLPLELFSLSNLETLDLYHNRICSLPEQIRYLSNLEVLNIAHNCLTTPPEGITDLAHLEYLNLSHNSLSSVPEEIRKIRSVNLNHNPLSP